MVVALGFAMFGCRSTEDRCETVCDWLEKCLREAGADEGECDAEECAEDLENESDSCQDSFEEFADCLEEDDSCDEGSECAGEANNFVEDCD